ncbi:unnamed protein product [Diatraea saccharalis]|uniref:Uncharacterized protein n=1 Tax=Diatraea saccharalis TaxID=40085 RepID=A0A9N9W9Q7_9NEOP|nr:unnamed protein product [Diatraea saccharalis]
MKYMVVLAALVVVAHSASFPASRFNSPRFGVPSPPPRPVPSRVAPAPVRAYSNDQAANTVRDDRDISPDGSYNYAFETDNGIAVQEQGTPRDFGGNPPLVPVVAQGSFAYTAPGGEPISISYVADENGFQPQGDSIPTAPPVPAQIARALEYLRKAGFN